MTQPMRARLLSALADGRFHSGQRLAEHAGISRTAVWKHIRGLKRRGLDIFAVSGRGYRLATPLDLLDADHIMAALDRQTSARVRQLSVLHELASTNQFLLDMPVDGVHGHVCLAEYQSAGRGRHGNQWCSPIAAGLYLSIGWQVEGMAEPLTGLSLAAGVAALRALERCGVTGVQLKWPNDLVSNGRKLGGILLQVRGEITGSCLWVLGLGINVRLPTTTVDSIGQPVVDLATLAEPQQTLPTRSQLAAALINELITCLHDYPRSGFQPYSGDWQRHDCMTGRQVTLTTGSRNLCGQMLGVDSHGALLLAIRGEVRRFAAGELSLRAVS